MSFGRQLLELKASYFEKAQPPLALNGFGQQNNSVQRFLDVLGSSSLGGMGFMGEGELTYSPLDSPPPGQHLNVEWPKMLRLGIKNRLNGISFGADYRSIDQGFISIAGARTDQARDEGQFWSESAIGPFNLRGSVSQSWEHLLDGEGIQTSKTATASITLNQSQWGGTLTSSYALVNPANVDLSANVIKNSLIGSYRPFKNFSFGPGFTMKQQWDRSGVWTESPATGFSFAYGSIPDTYKLTAGTSFARSFSTDRTTDLKTLDTTAVLDWKIGKFLGRDDVLSFNLKYNYQLDLVTPVNSRRDLTGMLQLKVVGF